MKTLLQAIATYEGFYQSCSRPCRNNNPGDLVWGTEAKFFGAIKGDPEYAVFESTDDGWFALQKWLSVPAKFEDGKLVAGYLGATLEQVIFRFAPPSTNDSQAYLDFVCGETGYAPSTVLTLEMLA
jgi:hypothetical protein